jgi:hypothetical protein
MLLSSNNIVCGGYHSGNTRMSDYCLAQTEQLVSVISWREQATLMRWWWWWDPLWTRTKRLVWSL